MTSRYRIWPALSLCGLALALLACAAVARSEQAGPSGDEPWPFTAVDYGETSMEVREVDASVLSPLNAGTGPVAFVLSVNIDGTLTLFYSPGEVQQQPLQFPKDVVRLLNTVPITIVYYDQEGNTHRCTGSTTGGDGSSFCPAH